MTALHTTFSERLILKPGLLELTPAVRQLGFALVLFDGFTKRNALAGVYEDAGQERADQEYADRTGDPGGLGAHTTVRLAGRPLVPYRKAPASTYLFFGDLPTASYVVEVRSPYYVSRDITVPFPLSTPGWPAFPDVALANEDLPLDSALQPAAYRAQRAAATLVPSTQYPFPATATLVRGTVRSGGTPLEGATVTRAGGAEAYVTDGNGDYVLFLADVPGVGAVVTIDVTHPLHAPASAPVQALRGMTVLRDIAVA